MAKHSALLLGLWRLFGRHATGQRPRPPTDLEPPDPQPVVPQPVEPPPVAPPPVVPPPVVPVPADTPSQNGTPWILAGLIVLGVLAITASQVLFKGGLHAVNIPNVPYFLAALVAVVALCLHIYSFRKWILPLLNPEGFPTTPFGDPTVTMGFYRTVWNFYTVAWLGTIILMFFFAFGDIIPYVTNIVEILIIFWIGILVVIFLVTALSLGPDDSYVKTMIKAYQWVFVLILVILMYWGTKV